jgi:flavorubredoxin
MVRTYEASPGIQILTSSFPIPGLGIVPINAFLLDGPEPMLVDTGAMFERDEFLRVLRTVIEPRDLRWIWLTHTDFDHVGSMQPLLEENPQLRVVTTFLGAGMMSLFAPLPFERLYFVNPGERLTIGTRSLLAIRPPTFDNPCTTGLLDESTHTLFTSDCFGALLSEVPDRADELPPQVLSAGQVFWATVDTPWIHRVDPSLFQIALEQLAHLQPSLILCSHLPPAPGSMLEPLLASLTAARTAPPFVGPDQATFQQMLAVLPHPGPSAPTTETTEATETVEPPLTPI